MGSAAERVVRHSPCPILVVRRAAKMGAIPRLPGRRFVRRVKVFER
jgi:hypothetical protein